MNCRQQTMFTATVKLLLDPRMCNASEAGACDWFSETFRELQQHGLEDWGHIEEVCTMHVPLPYEEGDFLGRDPHNKPVPITQDMLWNAQVEHWPNSIRLSPADMFAWADAPIQNDAQLRRCQALTLALQYPVHVFYRTDNVANAGYLGFRYGLWSPDYVSLEVGA